jgi:hypothetical protein
MPKNYGILDEEAGSGLLPWNRGRERLAASRNYWIHTTRPDGQPHVKPVWGLWFEDRFYFGTSPRSVAGQNLSVNHWLAVHLESGDDVVILEGRAEQVTDRVLLSRLDESYIAKYSYHLASEDGATVYTLYHKVAFAWLERDFVGDATKYNFQT